MDENNDIRREGWNARSIARRPNQDQSAEAANHKPALLFTDERQGVLRPAAAFSKTCFKHKSRKLKAIS
jgi:hypothetical protein